ncbi:methyltransferase domain-containing protein [bacterium]|nr:methyltransferase domain-containing protein [bacterium]
MVIKFWFAFKILRAPKKFITKLKLRRIINTDESVNAHFGAGPFRLKGWLNFDIIPRAEFYFDAKEKLPFSNEKVDRIFSEHFIEHLTPKEAGFWLSECHRVLKKGGRIRISTPGLTQLISQYSGDEKDNKKLRNRHEKRFPSELKEAFSNVQTVNRAILFNDKLRLWGGHKFIFDEQALEELLEIYGFEKVSTHAYGESKDQVFMGLERHAEQEPLIMAETIQIEAEKI